MRNTIKYRAIHFHILATKPFNPDLNFDLFGWGRTDSELMDDVNTKKNAQIASIGPTYSTTVTFDAVIDAYFLLNQSNLLRIIQFDNGASFFNNFIPWSGNPTPGLEDLAQVNKSPRATFPTDLGTDGQRLRQGQSKTAGAALNYIGKLFFLTSDARFFALFQSLKAGKITVKQALTEADAIAEARR